MFRHFFQFELRYWLQSLMVYVFFAVMTLMTLAAASSENVSLGGETESTLLNAPYGIQTMYATLAVLGSAVVTAFVNGAATREFSSNTSDLIFSTPIEKVPFLLGRFCGSTLVAILPFLGVSLGIVIAAWAPWVDSERVGPLLWAPHVWGLLIFAIPNAIFIGAIVFAIATWTRSTMASFIGLLLLLVGYILSQSLIGQLDNETLAWILDPFGLQAFTVMTKYWTVLEKNTLYVTLSGPLLWNRLLWLTFSMALLGLVVWRFRFSVSSRPGRTMSMESSAARRRSTLPPVSLDGPGWALTLRQLTRQIRFDFYGIVRSPIFLAVMSFAILNLVSALMLASRELYGVASLPVTYKMIDLIRGAMYAFLLAVITFYAGVLVWQERERGIADVVDALPQPTWVIGLGKWLALNSVILLVLGLGMMSGVMTQIASGYWRLQWSLYVVELFGWDFLQMACLATLAMAVHVFSPNKYIGYFGFIFLCIANVFLWQIMGWESTLLRYGVLPRYTYSDMFGFTPYLPSLLWYSLHAVLSGVVLGLVVLLFWQRGRPASFGERWSEAGLRWRSGLGYVTGMVIVGWLGSFCWIYYNTILLNPWQNQAQREQLQVAYEQKYSGDVQHPLPRITHVRYDIELFPEVGELSLRGRETAVNRSQVPIERLSFTLAPDYHTHLEISGARLEVDDPQLHYQVYRLDPPLEPGQELTINYTVTLERRGFDERNRNVSVVSNGSFFNNQIAPQLGYQRGRELSSRSKRRRHGLEPPQLMPPLAPDDLVARGQTYVGNHSDWVEVESVISTAPDQIAVAPGTMVRHWEENGRRFYHYRLDRSSLNFYSFASARYQVALRRWNDVDLEVYYHPDHHWNVDKMLRAMRQSLEYCSEHFGPYRHGQARIIEFPRIANFAQAFPGTMPYSEGIGFIADLNDPNDIDMVFYVVAHEIAHQWWAHQVIGAEMEGATLLSETLAQYSALMVMEREYGRDMMRKFLRHEMDTYLQGRGQERLEELPLKRVQAHQAYIHYNKGSVAMYLLKEMIGEDAVNRGLRSLVDRFAYREPPYPTSWDLIQALEAQTPEEYSYLIEDLFRRVVLYDNRVVDASYRPLEDGTYELELTIECRKLEVDPQGQEHEVAMNDWIEVGAFAAPEPGSRYGATLVRQRHRLTSGRHVLKLVCPGTPQRGGIDPFSLLIDRTPEDNLRTVRRGP